MDVITLGGGCFWCVEAVFKNIKGIDKLEPGYSGGHLENPSYDDVCTGTTGHAEVVRLAYDEEVISLYQVLRVFFTAHDPTTLNRQGNDVGTMYRSCIFYHNNEQKAIIEEVMSELAMEEVYEDPIVTQVEALANFYPAETYHQNYFYEHQDAPYCSFVISPKVKKVKDSFRHLLK